MFKNARKKGEKVKDRGERKPLGFISNPSFEVWQRTRVNSGKRIEKQFSAGGAKEGEPVDVFLVCPIGHSIPTALGYPSTTTSSLEAKLRRVANATTTTTFFTITRRTQTTSIPDTTTANSVCLSPCLPETNFVILLQSLQHPDSSNSSPMFCMSMHVPFCSMCILNRLVLELKAGRLVVMVRVRRALATWAYV